MATSDGDLQAAMNGLDAAERARVASALGGTSDNPENTNAGGGDPARQVTPELSEGHLSRQISPVPSAGKFSRQVSPEWTQEKADDLQASVDLVFGTSGQTLLGLEFSFTIADPFIVGCPLIGCSTGFTKLCGYEMNDIVGRNCRFLVNPVPAERQYPKMRKYAKEFCEAVKESRGFRVPETEREQWMRVDRPDDELLCMQMNARKDGSLFKNLFYMKVFEIGGDLGDEQPYIVALQSELPDDVEALEALARNQNALAVKMEEVKIALAKNFFVGCSMGRQDLAELAENS